MSTTLGHGLARSRKAGPLLGRFIALAHWAGTRSASAATPYETLATVEELAALWNCSRRAAQQTLRRLAAWGFVA